MNVSLCTQIRNRTEFLLRTLPTWLACPAFSEIVVFDWHSDYSLQQFQPGCMDPRIVYVRLRDNLPYCLPKAKNAAIRATTSDTVFYVDSDILIDDSFPEDLYVPRDSFYQGEVEGIIATFGCCIFLKEQFQKVNGFNETLVGYGYEDADFYRRLQLAGYKRMPIVRGLSHIDHSDDLRGSQFDDKDIIRTALRNRVRARGHTWGPSDKQESFEVRVTTNADQRVILL